MPSEFLWSEWGAPDKICDIGTQKKTTMCGALRRRLPLIEETDEPPVYWPSCLTDKFNLATSVNIVDQTLQECMVACSQDEDCGFWTFNKTSSICHKSKILKIEEAFSGPQYVSGKKQCKGSGIFFPHCASLNANYTTIESVNMTGSNNSSIETIQDCIQSCAENPDCGSYLIKTNMKVSLFPSQLKMID